MAIYIDIPDQNLKAAINYQLNPERPPQEDITDEEMLSLTELIAIGDEIRDLIGIQAATNLIKLDLSENLIIDISPLSINPFLQLEILFLVGNQISDISPLSVSVFPALKDLRLTNNQIIDIDPLTTVNFPLLTSLSLHENQIVDINPISKTIFPKLEGLSLASNRISNISSLSISNFPDLIYLNLSYNQIKDISTLSISYFPTLRGLNLISNQIKDISVINITKFPHLYFLELSSNQISDLSSLAGYNFITFDAFNQIIKDQGIWNDGTLTISTAFLKNIDGTSPTTINNILPNTGVFNATTKTVTWQPISYNTQTSFEFIGNGNFSGVIIRDGNTGTKALQLQLSKASLVKYNAPVIFNNIIYKNGIEYDFTTGVITLSSAGLYYISWWVVVHHEMGCGNQVFGIKIFGGSEILGSASNQCGGIRGTAIIEVVRAPMQIDLANLTLICGKKLNVLLSNLVPIKADISIIDYFSCPQEN